MQTNNGGEFKSNIFKSFCLKNDIKLIFSSPYHSQSQWAVEAFNKTIIEKLRLLKIEEGKNFEINTALNKAIFI